MTAWLLVRAGARDLAVPAQAVERVVELTVPARVPGRAPAVRGVAPALGGIAPVVHLGAALGGAVPPHGVSPTGVAVTVGGRRVVLEVDAVTDLVGLAEEALPDEWRGGWAASAVRRDGALVPVLDVAWLATYLDGGRTDGR